MVVAPFENPVEVPALMPGVEVGKRLVPTFQPVVGDNPNVDIAHEVLADEVNTMIYVVAEKLRALLLEMADVRIMLLVGHLPQHVQTMELVEDLDGPEAASPVLWAEANVRGTVRFIDLLELLVRDPDRTKRIIL